MQGKAVCYPSINHSLSIRSDPTKHIQLNARITLKGVVTERLPTWITEKLYSKSLRFIYIFILTFSQEMSNW